MSGSNPMPNQPYGGGTGGPPFCTCGCDGDPVKKAQIAAERALHSNTSEPEPAHHDSAEKVHHKLQPESQARPSSPGLVEKFYQKPGPHSKPRHSGAS